MRNDNKNIRSHFETICASVYLIYSFLMLFIKTILVLFLLLLIVMFVLTTIVDSRAMDKAEKFCSSIIIGDDFKPPIFDSEHEAKYHNKEGSDIHIIEFDAFFLDTAQCQITVINGIVKSKVAAMWHF